ncbi:MAG: DEAD/DEAH box helicase [Bacteroidia bacterium]
MEKQFDDSVCIKCDVVSKTEIAVRAAFKAVNDSKQVAVLVPTTILALQHYKTFSERLKDFLSARLISSTDLNRPKSRRNHQSDLKRAKTDIIIGTHRLISKDVKFMTWA